MQVRFRVAPGNLRTLVQSHSQAVVCWLGGLDILHILTRRLTSTETSTEGVHGGLLSGTGGGDYSTGAEAWGDHCRGRSPAAAAEGWGRRQLPVCATPGGAKWRGEVADGAPETPDGAPEMMATGPLFATTIAVWQDVYTKTKSTSVPHIRRGLVFNTRAPGPSLAAGWSLAGAGTWLNF